MFSKNLNYVFLYQMSGDKGSDIPPPPPGDQDGPTPESSDMPSPAEDNGTELQMATLVTQQVS